MRKIINFIIVFIPWLLSGFLFSSNVSFYDEINLPIFAIPKQLFSPIWTILYILISLSITFLLNKNFIKYEKEYKKALIFNYIFNQLFLFFFFQLQNIFLGFIDSILIFITSLFLYYETKEFNKKSSYLLLPYVFFSLYATILTLTIYFMNL
jgi:tryptophan-rich sensory protein